MKGRSEKCNFCEDYFDVDLELRIIHLEYNEEYICNPCFDNFDDLYPEVSEEEYDRALRLKEMR